MTDPQRKPMLACGALVAVAIAIVSFGRGEKTPVSIDPAMVAESMDISFEDRDDGSVVAIDPRNGAELERAAPGQGGFIRVTMRSFAAERKNRGLGAEVPFTLIRKVNGDVVLRDPVTGRTMLLDAFGPSNKDVFAVLLDQGSATR